MLKRILALCMIAASLVILSPQVSQAATCSTKYDQATVFFEGGDDGQDAASVTLYYEYCVNYNLNGTIKSRWVRPDWSVNYYNAAGGSMSCNSVFRRLDGFRFNWYFYQWDGAAINPGPIELPCAEDGIYSKTQDYDLPNLPKLWWGSNDLSDWPRWQVTITQMRNNNDDRAKTLNAQFNPNA